MSTSRRTTSSGNSVANKNYKSTDLNDDNLPPSDIDTPPPVPLGDGINPPFPSIQFQFPGAKWDWDERDGPLVFYKITRPGAISPGNAMRLVVWAQAWTNYSLHFPGQRSPDSREQLWQQEWVFIRSAINHCWTRLDTETERQFELRGDLDCEKYLDPFFPHKADLAPVAYCPEFVEVNLSYNKESEDDCVYLGR